MRRRLCLAGQLSLCSRLLTRAHCIGLRQLDISGSLGHPSLVLGGELEQLRIRLGRHLLHLRSRRRRLRLRLG